ncbi:MAG: twin-arginine translocase subunit TatC [Candidatus Wallbacteria bacterium]|nr:twin-arginine translocase subunit TatC [Candidatus Wallbacteria bacterium]
MTRAPDDSPPPEVEATDAPEGTVPRGTVDATAPSPKASEELQPADLSSSSPAADSPQPQAALAEPGAHGPEPRVDSPPRAQPPIIESPEPDDDVVMSLVDHLTELRNRLLASFTALGVLTMLCLFISDRLIAWLKATAPPDLEFYTTNPTEVFTVYVKTAAIGALVLAIPFLFYQLWEFIRPGLKKTERKYTRVFVPVFTLFFFIGAAFARYVAIPLGVAFLIGFAKGIAKPIYTVSEYTSFVLELMLVCGLLFEFPIILYLMGSLGLVTSTMLRNKRKHVIFWIFVIAAGVTPSTDAGTQIAMALPICVLFEITIVVMRLRGM